MHIGGGSFTFQTIDRGGHEFFSAIRIQKSRGYNWLHYKYSRVLMRVWKRGVRYFSHPDGGGYAILSSRNRGGQHFFSYSEALSATTPSAEIYEQSLKWLSSDQLVHPRTGV